MHVDGTVGGETVAFQNLMQAESGDLKIRAKEQSFSITKACVSTLLDSPHANRLFELVDGGNYLDGTVTMMIPSGLCNEEFLPPAGVVNFRSVAGCMEYIANAFRPDLALEASLLGHAFGNCARCTNG
jgi:hypothetical protein